MVLTVSDLLDLAFTSLTYFKSKTFPLIYPTTLLRGSLMIVPPYDLWSGDSSNLYGSPSEPQYSIGWYAWPSVRVNIYGTDKCMDGQPITPLFTLTCAKTGKKGSSLILYPSSTSILCMSSTCSPQSRTLQPQHSFLSIKTFLCKQGPQQLYPQLSQRGSPLYVHMHMHTHTQTHTCTSMLSF